MTRTTATTETSETFPKTISVVISCLNESKNISKCILSVKKEEQRLPDNNNNNNNNNNVRTKVIVVDGGSTDDTVCIAKKHAGKDVVVIRSNERGRAKQFNRGGMEAFAMTTGKSLVLGDLEEEGKKKKKRFEEGDDNILVFLHADTTMPETYREDIYEALSRERERRARERRFPSAWGVIKNGCANAFAVLGSTSSRTNENNETNDEAACWGAFPIKLSGERSKWRKSVVASLANFRTRRTSIPYGDQAIFVTASAFAKHKFDESKTFMEDYEYSLRLKKCFGKPAMVKSSAPVVTDSRRFESVGFMNTTMINILCVVGFHLKVDVERLAKFYRNANKKRELVDSNG
jgi:glycosyltransferase involved in cell wall biosynthesis